MRKTQIKEGELYAADGPGDNWSCAKHVRVRVLEAGVIGERRRRGGAKADSSRVRLEDDVEWEKWSEPQTAPAGTEYIVRNARITHPWTEADDQRVEAAEQRKSSDAELRDFLLRLGIPEAIPWHMRSGEERAELRAKAREAGEVGENDLLADVEAEMRDEPGFTLKPSAVSISRELFVAWLKRVEPGTIAAEAINQFVEEVKRDQPWKGLADAEEAELTKWRDAAVREVEGSIAVAEIAVG